MTPGYQRSLARAIHDGIVDYFRDNPPADSYFALNSPPQRQSPAQHVISRGETLSGIAQHYNVSLPTLKQVNSLSGDVIRIGQVLSIPAG
jgi:N-acetylmuramoyl-L-alanine amidase